jgi:hypothetical protein
MLRIGVVPRDAVVLEEREHLESTFLEAFLVIDRDFRREAPITNGLHKAMNVLFMLMQMPSLQAEFVILRRTTCPIPRIELVVTFEAIVPREILSDGPFLYAAFSKLQVKQRPRLPSSEFDPLAATTRALFHYEFDHRIRAHASTLSR